MPIDQTMDGMKIDMFSIAMERCPVFLLSYYSQNATWPLLGDLFEEPVYRVLKEKDTCSPLSSPFLTTITPS